MINKYQEHLIIVIDLNYPLTTQMESPVSALDILALTAKYLRENSPKQAPSTSTSDSSQQPSTEPQVQKQKHEEPVLPVQKINIRASDKENSKKAFRKITTEELSTKISQKYNLEKRINDPPAGTNFFYECHNAYNGCHSAAWQIEQSPNNLLKAVVLAFAYHLPLRLKPDHILYAILSGFNMWVNEMGGHQKLAQKGLVDESKKNITIEISTNPDWDQVVDTIGNQLEEAITNRDLIQIMKGSFTTTTQTMMRVKNLTVASIMKKFVRIEFSTWCGIPYVTIEGSPQDWEKLKVITNALLALADGELNWWLVKLNEGLDVMIETSKGNNTEAAWINFLNFKSHSGFHGFDGWLNSFFPYVKETEHNPKNIVTNALLKKDPKEKYHVDCINFSNVLPSTSTESYEWKLGGNPYKTLHITAGLVDVIQWTGEDFALEPFIGYQIDSTKV